MRTTADENLEKARKALSECKEALAEIVVSECYGHDSYSDTFRTIMQDALFEVMQIARKLK